jgi:putative hemolysin
MAGIAIEVIFLLVLIIANGVLAMSEIAIVSARKARLQQRSEEGDTKASAALELSNDPADFLSTIQIGITLVGVLAGAFGGATIAEQISEWISKIQVLAPYSEVIGVFVVVILITYFTLVLGELVPKRLALNDPERMATAIAGPMQRLSRIASPLVQVLSISSDFTLRLLGAKPSKEPPVTEEEIKVLIEQGTQAGVFAEAEQDMVEAIFRLGDRRVGNLMTPRTEVIWIDIEEPLEGIQRKLMGSSYSRFPVAEGSLDKVVGLVEAKDVLASCLHNKSMNLKELMRQPLYVPESMLALKVLEIFRESRVHIALVIDEFGGFQGLVTLFDILESIVGDIPELGELAEPEVIQRDDGTWLVDGMLPVDEFKEIFHLNELPEEERGYYQTLGGLVMTQLGRIPSASDYFDWSGLRFEVVDMDGMRVDKILISLVEDEEI